MKSLKFQKLNLQERDLLDRTQMQKILGGDGYDQGTCVCPDGSKHHMYCNYPDECNELCRAICGV